MQENQSGMSTPPMQRQKEMRSKHQLGMFLDPLDVIDQSSMKATPGKSQSPKLLHIDSITVAERVKDYYDDMVVKVKDGEEATDRWRKERALMYYINSPTNVPKPLAFNANII
jgi:hypothetical protein